MNSARLIFFFFAVWCLVLSGAQAMEAGEALSNPHREARARALCAKVKCPTCQGQCIDDSNARLAADLRRFIRQAVEGGASDASILSALTATYGKEVLFEPAWEKETLVLWTAPFIFLFVCAGMWGYKRRRHL